MGTLIMTSTRPQIRSSITPQSERKLKTIVLHLHSFFIQAWFSYVWKILGDRGFNFLQNVPDFADVSDNCQKSVSETPCLSVIEGLEPRNLEIGNGQNPSLTSLTVQILVFI